MAKTKAELLEEAKVLELKLSEKNTIAELTAAIKAAAKTEKKTTKTNEQEADDGNNQEVNKDEVQTDQKPAKEVKTAKAGKRSTKGLKEAEEKVTKVEAQQHREATENEPDSKPKHVQKVRSRLERRGKNYRKLAEQVDKTKSYSLKEALELATKTSPVKFDASVELHIRLNVDPKQADQNLRDTVALPAGTGKTIRVAVFADADQVKTAKTAGADIAASEEFLQQLEKGVLNFDILISTPQNMAKLGKYARLLGPKGLMPNPKSGTVTTDVAKAVKEAKAGRVEYRVDSTGIVHVSIGKVSFGAGKLEDNAQAILTSLKSNKPGSIKGAFVRSMFVSTSMGPSIRLNDSEL